VSTVAREVTYWLSTATRDVPSQAVKKTLKSDSRSSLRHSVCT